jgi:hypothetical protein
MDLSCHGAGLQPAFFTPDRTGQFSQGSEGRDHNGGTGIAWMAGAGESDEWAWKATKPLYSYDLPATVLHLLGIDDEKLTYRHNGSDRRLTDVHGHVIKAILASTDYRRRPASAVDFFG